MKLNHLLLVKTVAEVGSLIKASKKLHLSQPALSHQLKDLEEYLNIEVFKRIGKSLKLTDVGKRILKSANEIIDNVNNLEKDIKSNFLNSVKEITLASSCYTGYYWLPNIIKEFTKDNENVEINISHEATDDPIGFLLENNIDLAIVSRKKRNPNIEYLPVFKDKLVVIVSKNHEWKDRKSINIEEFQDQKVIIYPRPITAFQNLLNQNKVTPFKKIKVQLTEARVEMVKANLGVSVMANWAVKPYIERNEIIPINLTKNGIIRTWYAAYRKNDSKKNLILSLLPLIKKKMKKKPI